MQTGNNIYIVGIGADGRRSLTEKALKIIREARILIGANRVLSDFRSLPAKKIHISSDIDKIITVIKENRDKRIVVLASGDPNHYGISKKILGEFSREKVNIIPNVSSMQLAFAAIKEPMDGAVITSVHGRPIESLLEAIRSNEKVGIYTDPENDPIRIASMLLEKGINGYTAYVCEDLGTKDEKVFKSRLSGIVKRRYSRLNIMILIRENERTKVVNEIGVSLPSPQSPVPSPNSSIIGIPDDEFSHAGNMITKAEIRVQTLARLNLSGPATMWDIGAGSGSVSIEASGLIPTGSIYAIEKDKDQTTYIYENIKRFSRKNIMVYEGEAPDILRQIPDPDRVFIGGSGGRLKEILVEVIKRLLPGGIVVVNAVTTSTLSNAVQLLKENRLKVEITSVNIAKSKVLRDSEILEPMTPTFIITGKRLEG